VKQPFGEIRLSRDAGRFIVSTGRCGSTLLSELLLTHPAVLSLSELFAMLQSERLGAFPADELDGGEMWRVLSTPRPEITEMQRSCGDAEDPTPPLLMFALNGVAEDPAGLHDELGAYVRSLPEDSIGAHYSRVFAWLCERCGRRLWVERSGFSTYFLADLVRWWPDGRYVHLVRDGREAAISMSRRPGRYLAVLYEELRRSHPSMSVEDLVAAAMAAARASSVPLERFGKLWSDHVVAAHERLSALPPEQVLSVRFEDLTACPELELRRIVDFLGAGQETTPEWLAAAAARIEPREPRAPRLADEELAGLEAACRPGQELLGYR
jgi:putative sulfotransferase